MPYAFDPELAAFVDSIPPTDITDLAGARAGLAGMLEPLNADVDTSGLRIVDHDVPGPGGASPVLVRVYCPDAPAPIGGRPALLDIHGGGFVLGDITMQHGIAAIVARELGALVAVVEYRLAPEHPFPAGVEDCYAALRWLHDEASTLGVDTARVAVGGQSAGGGLAAAVALLARDRGGPPLCFQVLGIPELDHRLETTSMRTFVDTPLWHRPNAVLSWRYYLGPDAGEVSPYASPAIAEDLRGLPPAYVTAMEFDPLRDEGILYALRLLEAGVPVELHTFPGTFHGSGAMVWAGVSRRGAEEQLGVLRRALRVD
jgi:acetyl esterase